MPLNHERHVKTLKDKHLERLTQRVVQLASQGTTADEATSITDESEGEHCPKIAHL